MIITIAFLVVAMIALLLFYRFVQNHAHGTIQTVRQLDRIVDRLDLIKSSVDFASGEVTAPILADIRTDINKISRRVHR